MIYCTSDNIALDERPAGEPAGKHYQPPRENYIPARDNPPAPIRPGAEDHQKYRSTTDHDGKTVYRRHHP